jgi:hypothetical protein
MQNAIQIEINRLSQINELLDARNDLECILLRENKDQIQLYRRMLADGETETLRGQ